MKLVIFGLTITSSWGNGHATLWRGLVGALARLGHDVVFVERDQPWYAENRDLTDLPGATLRLYADWSEVDADRASLVDADAFVVTSYCPDAMAASRLVAACPGLTIFYDLDTPVTLARAAAGLEVPYYPPEGLGLFDLVLSYTGGPALRELETRFGARLTATLYGHVDPALHRPTTPRALFAGHLSYLGTYAADRQPMLEELFVAPAAQRADLRFVLGGSSYPADFPWQPNIFFMSHVAPADHPAFFCSSRLTLNVTRADMARMGWCPSGRLFEAAACGTPILTDRWDGLDRFFCPGEDILVAETRADVLAALELTDAELRGIATRARERVLSEHSSARRASEFIGLIEAVATGAGQAVA